MDRGKYLIMFRGKPFRVEDEGEVVRLLLLLREEFGEYDAQKFSASVEIYVLGNNTWIDCKAKFM